MRGEDRGDGAAALVTAGTEQHFVAHDLVAHDLVAQSSVAQGTSARDDCDRARAAEYLLLASLLRAPPNDILLGNLAQIRGDASPIGMAHIALAEAARHATPAAVAREYTSLFIGVGRGDILPYGSYYLTGFLHERPLARVREDMARLGIERQAAVFEPEDHISSLLEVMAGLIGGEFDQPAAAADEFFERHLARWVLRLMSDIAAAPSALFYRTVAELGRVFLEIELEAMQIPR